MPVKIDIARKLITAKQMGTAAVTHQPRSFGMRSSKSREARITVTFGAVNVPICVYHGLGFAPSGVTVVTKDRVADIYTDMPLVADSRTVVVKCDTANVVAELIVR